jgi:hypothetical protein
MCGVYKIQRKADCLFLAPSLFPFLAYFSSFRQFFNNSSISTFFSLPLCLFLSAPFSQSPALLLFFHYFVIALLLVLFPSIWLPLSPPHSLLFIFPSLYHLLVPCLSYLLFPSFVSIFVSSFFIFLVYFFLLFLNRITSFLLAFYYRYYLSHFSCVPFFRSNVLR